ncbi:hypothetical protein DD238_004319 [Peronospora effusa]|uniref:Uncharacterized protein n=1 Tax=Peronospora effusa TaxID=542832 RepID=A0A3M6VGJ9_9STRA|nr:hypothetical protein DD238_004319 [Peronospora effusa]
MIRHEYRKGLIFVGAGVVRALSSLDGVRNFRRIAFVEARALIFGVRPGGVKGCRHKGRACEEGQGESEVHICWAG